MGSKKIYIFALAAHGEGISGGDRIFIEFARHWSKNYPVTIYVWNEGYRMCQRQRLKESRGIKYQISSMEPWRKLGFVVNYFARIIEGIRLSFTIRLENKPSTIIYSASEFWMDSLSTFILKLRYPKIKWMAAWYQTAPNPIKGFSEGEEEGRDRLRAFVYWLMQLPVKPWIDNFADFVLVNNDDEKKVFGRLNSENKVLVVIGAINLDVIKNWQKKLGSKKKIYDAVFQGRFHPQKGVLELIDIWKMVVNKKPDAKLTMIGDGLLMKNVKLKIKNEKLDNNVQLTGYLFDGQEKYEIFAQTKIVVHPAVFDSGGMASFEAMSFGLPCVGFNLASYKYYYPKGMEKVSVGNLEAFAAKILQLLSDKKLYDRVSKDAYHLVRNMTWEVRSRQILNQVLE